MDNFITVLAWIGLVIGLVGLFICAFGALTYTDLEKMRDAFHGVERTWPIGKWVVMTCVSGAWLISKYYM